jgi:hypothetical protein
MRKTIPLSPEGRRRASASRERLEAASTRARSGRGALVGDRSAARRPLFSGTDTVTVAAVCSLRACCKHGRDAGTCSAPYDEQTRDPSKRKYARTSSALMVWTRRATTARSPKRSFLGPAERKHRRAGSSEQQILLLARGEAGASTRDRDAIGSRFEQKAARTRSRLLLLPVVAHARDRALADRASVSALIDRCCFHKRSGVVDPAALARIAARAGSDSRLQPVKHEPHGSGATLSLAFPKQAREGARLGPLRLLLPPIGGVCRAVARTSGLALSGRFRLTADTLARHPVAAAAERRGCFARGLRSASRDSWDRSGAHNTTSFRREQAMARPLVSLLSPAAARLAG